MPKDEEDGATPDVDDGAIAEDEDKYPLLKE
jgi:hypothetical protein